MTATLGVLVLLRVLLSSTARRRAPSRHAPARATRRRRRRRDHVELVVVPIVEGSRCDEAHRRPQLRRTRMENGSPRGMTPITVCGLDRRAGRCGRLWRRQPPNSRLPEPMAEDHRWPERPVAVVGRGERCGPSSGATPSVGRRSDAERSARRCAARLRAADEIDLTDRDRRRIASKRRRHRLPVAVVGRRRAPSVRIPGRRLATA